MPGKNQNDQTGRITIRLGSSELATISRLAREHRMSKSEYIRDRIFSPAGERTRGEDLEELRNRLDEIAGEIAENFNELVQGIKELIRVPSFREFRGRCIVEGWEKYPKETDSEFTIRVAKAYFQKYGIWPDPVANPKDFGPMPKDITAEAWPRKPI